MQLHSLFFVPWCAQPRIRSHDATQVKIHYIFRKIKKGAIARRRRAVGGGKIEEWPLFFLQIANSLKISYLQKLVVENRWKKPIFEHIFCVCWLISYQKLADFQTFLRIAYHFLEKWWDSLLAKKVMSFLFLCP